MFFKRSQQEPADKPEATTMSSTATPPRPLAASELRRLVDPATLGFKSTAELEPILGLIGQERALKAIQFGASIKSHDFNVFVLGPAASGKTTAVRQYLERTATSKEAPADWIYVNNFDNPNRPRALKLLPGRARSLAKGMIAAVSMPAHMLALRLLWLRASKRRAFSPSRDIDCTARTPETFSARVP